MENNLKNFIVLDKGLHNRCLEYLKLRKVSEKTYKLYTKELSNIFKNKLLTQTLYNSIYSKGNYYKSVLKLIIDTCNYFDIPAYKYKTVKPIPIKRHIPQVWAEKDIIRMIDNVKEYGLLIACAYYVGAGLRFGSAIMLSWNDFMWDEWIEDMTKTGKCLIKYSKGDKEKILRVDPSLMNRLYNIAKNKGKLFQGIPYKNSIEDKHLFVKQRELDELEDRYKKQNFENVLDSNKEQINVKARAVMELIDKKHRQVDYRLKKLSTNFSKKIKFHSIRHSKATNLLRKGFKLLTIKDQLMHTSIATTEIYLNMENADIEKEFDDKL